MGDWYGVETDENGRVIVGQTVESIAAQHGEHLLLDLGDGGGQVRLAWTTLAELAGIDVLV